MQLLHFNQLSPLPSFPSFIILSFSIIPHSTSHSSLPSAAACLDWDLDKWERMNTLGVWGSRRAECEGRREKKGGRGVTWTRHDRLVRKIKNSQWRSAMNGSHYEWFAERGYWKKLRGECSDEMTEDDGGFTEKDEKAGPISQVQWKSMVFSMLQIRCLSVILLGTCSFKIRRFRH